ncbi:MAG TPA: hypothetical protein PK573_11385 [Spirochaetota bacterium]|nr:hypothetical protein [Spirochaetota bacterium]HRZ28965.1 hypothetical protein [Spirochaetota bacterium]
MGQLLRHPKLKDGLYVKTIEDGMIRVADERYAVPADIIGLGRIFIEIKGPEVWLAGMDGRRIMKLDRAGTGTMRASL